MASEETLPVNRAYLPAAAQRWLERALPALPGQPGHPARFTAVRLEQAGEMEIRGRWTPFTAHGYYTAAPLAFRWQARFHLLPGVWLIAEDGHDGRHGWGGARLWGLISLGRRTEPQVHTSQLVRNLAELPWLPQLALSDPTLVWVAAGPAAFEIHARAGNRPVMVHFQLNPEGDITRASSPARPFDTAGEPSGGYGEAPWHYEFGEHRRFNGLRLPAAATARFEKESGIWEYIRLRLISTTYIGATA